MAVSSPQPSAHGPVSLANQFTARNRQIPAWLLSVTFHALILLMFGFTLRMTPRGVAVEPDRTAGIVLVKHAQGEREYFDENDSQLTEVLQSRAAGATLVTPSLEELAVDVSEFLPQEAPGAGQVTDSKSSAPRSGDLGGGTAAGKSFGGSARTGVFGVYGEGNRFVYVFDRSGSMSGFGGRPLQAAKAELITSLGDLQGIHQFQIIFYNNEQPRVFDPRGGSPRLEWADETSKELARAFVRGIDAVGGTEHLAALKIGLGLRPDVIFFLTDADEPRLSSADLAKVRRLNRGTAISAVEFGFGPQRDGSNFLVRLAEQNDGQHIYVDVSQLPAR